MDTPNPFKWRHFKAESILLCVRSYVRSSLRYRDLEEMMAEHVPTVDHPTIYRWVQHYLLIFDQVSWRFMPNSSAHPFQAPYSEVSVFGQKSPSRIFLSLQETILHNNQIPLSDLSGGTMCLSSNSFSVTEDAMNNPLREMTTLEIPDEELVSESQNGDWQSFEELIQRHQA